MVKWNCAFHQIWFYLGEVGKGMYVKGRQRSLAQKIAMDLKFWSSNLSLSIWTDIVRNMDGRNK